MKHLLSGVALAAALASAAPAWAQAPASPPAGASTAPAQMAPTQRHKRMPAHHYMAKAPGNSMTNQLNREELARIQGTGAMPPPAPMSGVPGQPSPTAGIPGAGQPSASTHPTPQSPMPQR